VRTSREIEELSYIGLRRGLIGYWRMRGTIGLLDCRFRRLVCLFRRLLRLLREREDTGIRRWFRRGRSRVKRVRR
jgi:hypothetical protein